jgi:hypothetical protein
MQKLRGRLRPMRQLAGPSLAAFKGLGSHWELPSVTAVLPLAKKGASDLLCRKATMRLAGGPSLPRQDASPQR